MTNELCVLNITGDRLIIGYGVNTLWLRREQAMLLLKQLPELIAQMPVQADDARGADTN